MGKVAKPVIYICTPIRKFPEGFPVIEELKDMDTLLKALKEYADPEWLSPILELMEDDTLPWRFRLKISEYGGVARCRNQMAADFLRDPNGYMLFFLDYDLCPKKEDFVRIVGHNLPVCAGCYTTRQEDGNGNWVIVPWADIQPDDKGLWPVCHSGTGFKCFHRSALLQMIETYPWLEYEPDDAKGTIEWGFFSMGCVKSEKWGNKTRWLTEDYWFDTLFMEAGIASIVDTKVKVKHRHRMKVAPGKFVTKYFPENDPPFPEAKKVA